MTPIEYIQRDHANLKSILFEIENLIDREDREKYGLLMEQFSLFESLWKEHEEREEELFEKFRKNGTPFPTEKMLVRQHRDLKGHWKVLQMMLKTDDSDKLGVALDTDGRMLIEKFLKHIEIEDSFLNTLNAPSNSRRLTN